MAHLSIPSLIDCYSMSDFSQLKNNATHTLGVYTMHLLIYFTKTDFTKIVLEVELQGQ